MWPLTKGQIPAIQRQSASHKEIIDMLNTCMKLAETFKTGDEASQLKGVEGMCVCIKFLPDMWGAPIWAGTGSGSPVAYIFHKHADNVSCVGT